MADLIMLGRMALAIALCAIIGVEREFRGRPAGLRTHLLVGGGSALVMVIGASLTNSAQTGGAIAAFDVGRLIAGVLTGIGFLGAGTIIRQRDSVRGLTTAASVWFVAGIGVAAGQGLYVIAAGATAIGFLVLSAFSRLELRLPTQTRRVLVLRLASEVQGSLVNRLCELCAERHVRARLLSWEFDGNRNSTVVQLLLTYSRPVDIIELATALQKESHAIGVQVE